MVQIAALRLGSAGLLGAIPPRSVARAARQSLSVWPIRRADARFQAGLSRNRAPRPRLDNFNGISGRTLRPPGGIEIMLTKRITPITHLFTDDGRIPTIRSCRSSFIAAAIISLATRTREQVIEKVFTRNGWGDMWRNGIFPYVHYHSMIHEVWRSPAAGHGPLRRRPGRGVAIAAGDVVICRPAPATNARRRRGTRGDRRLSDKRQI